jgi:hypothetical protein
MRPNPDTFAVLLVMFAASFVAIIGYVATSHVSVVLKHGAVQPPPDCAWTAALYCDDVPGQECRWGRRWKCAANAPWPEVVLP